MPDTLTTHDDPVTAELMEGINEARILLASDAHRADLAEMAKISREMLQLQERYGALETRHAVLQEQIGSRDKVYIAAEKAMAGHLSKKHFKPIGQIASDVLSSVEQDE